jgi:Gram-negative bacterial TonB protein C-terminal
MCPRIFCAAVGTAFALSTASGDIVTEEQTKRLIVSARRPEYPLIARLRHAQGQGLFLLRVHIQTGFVKAVTVEHTTGSQLFDVAAEAALNLWRFKPGALPPISVELPKSKDALANEDSFVRVPVNFCYAMIDLTIR